MKNVKKVIFTNIYIKNFKIYNNLNKCGSMRIRIRNPVLSTRRQAESKQYFTEFTMLNTQCFNETQDENLYGISHAWVRKVKDLDPVPDT